MKQRLLYSAGIAGAVLAFVAIVTAHFYPANAMLTAVIAAAAFVLLISFFLFHFESLKAFSRKRSTHLGLNSALTIVLFVFIVVIFNLITRQYYLRLDVSSTGQFSLSPQTKRVVQGLDRPVVITVFGQETRSSFKKAKELLEGYRYLSRNVVYEVLDLDRAPIAAKEYDVSQYDTVVVVAEGPPVVTQGITEEVFTNAIIKATRKKQRNAVFLSGHGERDRASTARGGISRAAERLNAVGYRALTLNLSGIEAVPGDTDILIIAGPSQPFTKEDLRKLERYLTGGGKLLVLVDPEHEMNGILALGGMSQREGMIFDSGSNFVGREPATPLVTAYPDTPPTRDFRLSTLYPGVAAISIGDRGRQGGRNTAQTVLREGKKEEYEAVAVATSSGRSRLVSKGKSIDERGGYIIAALAGTKGGNDIIMAFGDSDFASNAYFDVEGNGNLFLNCVHWMAGEADLVSIAPRTDDFVPLYITAGQATALFFISVIGIPLSVLGFGLLVWWKRSRL